MIAVDGGRVSRRKGKGSGNGKGREDVTNPRAACWNVCALRVRLTANSPSAYQSVILGAVHAASTRTIRFSASIAPGAVFEIRIARARCNGYRGAETQGNPTTATGTKTRNSISTRLPSSQHLVTHCQTGPADARSARVDEVDAREGKGWGPGACLLASCRCQHSTCHLAALAHRFRRHRSHAHEPRVRHPKVPKPPRFPAMFRAPCCQAW